MSSTPAYLKALADLHIIDPAQIEIIHPRCRDSANMSVCRSPLSDVIFLRESTRDYSQGDVQTYYRQSSREATLRSCAEDDGRRVQQFRELARNATWLDVGAGVGGFMELVRPLCSDIVGVEPQEGLRRSATDAGLSVLTDISEAKQDHYDVVSLFHVFEHLSDPLGMLAACKQCLKPGGRLIVEVPHARDFLLSFLELEQFKDHTFWSEHLILHTRQSLAAFLKAGGFSVVAINGFQRYPLANHLQWLSKGIRGGHKNWSFLRSAILDAAYEAKLCELDMTDTIIATAVAP